MRLVAEHRTETNQTLRSVRIYTGGIREVFHQWHGESWSRYIIIPRRLVLNEIRKLRAKGCAIVGNWNFWELLPEGASDLIRSETNGYPGGPFVRAPYKMKSARKFVVICQSGGLDI